MSAEITAAVAAVEAQHAGWIEAVRYLHEVVLTRVATVSDDPQAMVAATASVLLGSTDAADAGMHLALLDAVAVVGATVV